MIKRILFVLAAVALFGAGFYVRAHNAKTAQTRQDQIVDQDASGADTAASLAAIKSYVQSHMGASAEFTLTSSYDRALAAAQASAAAQQQQNQVYADAQKACSGHTDSITQAKCNTDYIQKHLTNMPAPSTPVAEPKLADYQYKLHSPVWTPDLAGALLLAGVLSLGLAAYEFVRGRR